MFTGNYFIDKLKLKPHVEGGFYCECIKSEDCDSNGRNLFTSIYYLLKDRDVSHFHKLDSDEIWYYHSGTPLVIYIISLDGKLIEKKLGPDIERNEYPQILVRKGEIFGAMLDGTGYSLTGCMVAPGFQFDNFEIFKRDDLISKYPQYSSIIMRLTEK